MNAKLVFATIALVAGIIFGGGTQEASAGPEMGQICILKWHDVDGNGIRDGNPFDPLLGEWEFKITPSDENLVTHILQTSEFGIGCVDVLVGFEYTITEVVQPGWVLTTLGVDGTTFTPEKQGDFIVLEFGNTFVGEGDCESGYKLDGETCEDVDECSEGTNSCDVNAICTNIVGSYTCECDTGYQGDGTTCGDVNECQIIPDICTENQKCMNTDGAHSCVDNPEPGSNNIAPGYQLLLTKPGTTFDPDGSGPIPFTGVPIGSIDLRGTIGIQDVRTADTIIRRTGNPIFTSATEATISIEIVALQLRSVAPVVIDGVTDWQYVTSNLDGGDGIPDGEEKVDFTNSPQGEVKEVNFFVDLEVRAGSLDGPVIRTLPQFHIEQQAPFSFTRDSTGLFTIPGVNEQLNGMDNSEDFFVPATHELVGNGLVHQVMDTPNPLETPNVTTPMDSQSFTTGDLTVSGSAVRLSTVEIILINPTSMPPEAIVIRTPVDENGDWSADVEIGTGSWKITVSIFDSTGNKSTSTEKINVTVELMPKASDSLKEQKIKILEYLAAIETTDKKTIKELAKAIKEITNAIESDSWADDGNSLVDKDGKKVFDAEKELVKKLEKIQKEGEVDVTGTIDDLVTIDRKLALSTFPSVCPSYIAKADKECGKAIKEMGKAQEELDKGHNENAIDHYKHAWEKTEKAVKENNKDTENGKKSINVDSDGDGIIDELDTKPNEFSNEFFDKRPDGTFVEGEINKRGEQVEVFWTDKNKDSVTIINFGEASYRVGFEEYNAESITVAEFP